MSKSKKRRLPFEDIRAIPLSAESVEAGFEEVFADDDPFASFEKTLIRLKREKEIWGFLGTLTLRSMAAALMPEWEPTGRVAATSESFAMAGAAIYLACVRHEAKSKKISSPRVTMRDRTFFVNRLMPSEGAPVQHDSLEYVEEFAKIMLKSAVDSVTAFELGETEFCTKVLEMSPELGYDNDIRHDIILGAADLHGLFDAHYERRVLERMVS